MHIGKVTQGGEIGFIIIINIIIVIVIIIIIIITHGKSECARRRSAKNTQRLWYLRPCRTTIIRDHQLDSRRCTSWAVLGQKPLKIRLLYSSFAIPFYMSNCSSDCNWRKAKWDFTLILPTWRIWWATNNASKWQMGFNSVFNPYPANAENMVSS